MEKIRHLLELPGRLLRLPGFVSHLYRYRRAHGSSRRVAAGDVWRTSVAFLRANPWTVRVVSLELDRVSFW